MTVPPLTAASGMALRLAVGRRIASIMEARMIDRAELAAVMGISERKFCRVIKGSSDLPVEQLVWCAKALNVEVKDLTGR